MSEPKNEAIEQKLEEIAKTGKSHVINTSIYSDEDIRGFLYYRSKLLKSPELILELNYLIKHPGFSKMNDEYPSVFPYEEVPKNMALLASWYSGEKEEDAFKKTESRYLIGEKKAIHAILAFHDDKISKEFLYLHVSGRFASKDEDSLPIYWGLRKVHTKCLRDIILYFLEDQDLKILGIDLEPNSAPNSAPNSETKETKETKESNDI